MNSLSRTKNSKRNVLIGTFLALATALISFFVRTIFIKQLGNEYLGVNGLFTEIVSVMSLADLGIGVAVVYHLYPNIRDNNYKKITQLLNFIKKAFDIICFAYVFVGLLLMPFIKYFVNDITIDVSELQIIFFVFVLQAASSYLFSYKTVLINADQKRFVISIVSFLAKLFASLLAVLLLFTTRNYIAYLCVIIFQNLFQNILLSIYVNRNYPFVLKQDMLADGDKKIIFKDIKNIFGKRLSGVITNSTDNILISTMVSTLLVGIYSNYIMFFQLVKMIKTQITNGVAGSIGNLSVTESPERNISILKRLTFLYFIFGAIVCSGLIGVVNDFITIWIGADYLFHQFIIYVLITNLFLDIISDPLWQFLEVSGLFRHDKIIGFIGSGVNVILSILLCYFFGIVGIFVGTFSSLTIQFFLKTRLLFSSKFKKNSSVFLISLLRCAIGFCAICVINYFLVSRISLSNSILTFFVKGAVSGFFGMTVPFLCYIKTDEEKFFFSFVKNKIRRKEHNV